MIKYYISHILFFSHTVRRKTVRKSEVREMPSLPRGGGEELVRDEQVSSRKVCWSAVFVLFGLVFRAMKLIWYFNFIARSSPGTHLLPWHLTPCQQIYPLNYCFTLFCTCQCLYAWALSVSKYSVCVPTETARRLFEQAAEDGHVPKISPYCE